MKIKDYLNKTKLLDNGFEISDNQNHKIKLKVTKDKDSKTLKKDNYLFIENFNKEDDIEFVVFNDKVKENVIINKKRENYKYQYQLELVNLKLEKEDEEYIFLDSNTNEKVFKISEFIMFDSSNEMSKDIKLNINEQEDKLYLEVTPSSSWINDEERCFPIYVDPSIETVSTSMFEFTSNTLQNLIDTEQIGRVGIVDDEEHTLKLRLDLTKLDLELSNLEIKNKKYDTYIMLKYVNNDGVENAKYKISGGSLIEEFTISENNEILINIGILTSNLIIPGFPKIFDLTIERVDSRLHNTKNNIDIIIGDVENNELRPKIILNYKKEYDKAVSTKEITGCGAGTTHIDLQNGNFIHKVNVGSIKDNSLELPLDLVLNSNLLFGKTLDTKQKKMPSGWKTNFHQSINKYSSYSYLNESQNIYYIDGEGISHKLKESHYYELDNIRKYVSKDAVYYNENNELVTKVDGNEYLIKTEFTNEEGLTYIPTQGKLNFKRIESPTKQKRYYILTRDNNRIYLYKDDKNGLHLPCFYYARNDTKHYIPSTDIVINRNGSYLYHEIFGDEYMFAFQYNDVIVSLPSGMQATYEIEEKDESKTNVVVYVEETSLAINDEEVENYFVNEDIENINNQIDNIRQQIDSINLSLEDYKSSLACSYTELDIEPNLTGYAKHLRYYNFEHTYKKYMDAIDQLNHYTDLLRKYEFRKNELVKEQVKGVNDVLIDTNKNMLGFDGEGRLILIQDAYENTIQVVYGEDKDKDKILSIETSKEKITFEYDDNDLLSKIIDQYGRVTVINETTINQCEDSVYLNVKGERYEIINQIDSYNKLTFNKYTGKVVNLLFNEGKVSSYEEYYTGENGEGNNPFTGEVKHKEIHTFTYNETSTLETYTKDYNPYFNKENFYLFDGAGRLLTSLNYDNDVEIKEYEEKQIIKELAFNTLKDVAHSIEPASLATSYIVNKKYTTTGMLAFVIKFKNIFTTNDISTFDITVKDNETNVSKTYSKDLIINKEKFVVFELPVTKESNVTIYINNQIAPSNNDIERFYITRLYSNNYVYDKDDHLIKEYNPLREVLYEDFINDLPLKVVVKDLEHNEEMVTKYCYDSNKNITYKEDYLGNVEEYLYNERGQLLEKKTYNKQEPTLCKKEKYNYDDKGNVTSLDGVMKDKNGNRPSTQIEHTRRLTSKVKEPSGRVINYGYDYNSDNLLSISSEIDGVSNVNRFKYKHNLLESVEHDGFKVSYVYDNLGRKVETKVNDETYVTTEYVDFYENESSGEKYQAVVTNYNNDYTESYEYDFDGILKKVTKGAQYKRFTYDNNKNLTYVFSSDSTINKSYTYDGYNNVVSENSTGQYSTFNKTYTYDTRQRLTSKVENYASKTFTSNYGYNNTNKSLISFVSLNFDGLINVSYDYDVLNRLTKENININNTPFFTYEYEYLCSDEYSLELIKEHKVYFRNNILDTYTYEYDLNGNIIKVETSEDETRYHYDSNNRLIREDNPLLNKTITYKYDKRGNIILRKEYEYSLEENLINETKVDKFTYKTSGWKDQLVKYNNESFVYDSMGRPTTYRGMATSWNKDGTLSNMGDKYSYIRRNIDGVVIERRESSTSSVISSLVDGNRLLSENGLTFIYVLDKVVGFIYNNLRYYYQRNIQNDIVAIYSEGGTLVCKYVYDAYGRHKVLDASGVEVTSTTFIGNLNPYRYRGYYYDRVLGLYNLNSRYYDPETCRFISPDVISIIDETSNTINGLNLYMYCNDNPVNYSDGSGHSPDSIWKTLLGIAVGVGLAVVTVAAVVASGGTLLVPVLVGAGVGAGLNLVGQGFSNLSQGKGFFEDINWGNVALGGLSGAAFATGFGGLSGAVAIGATSNAGMSALEGNSLANIGFSALVGGASAFAGFKLGKLVSSKLLNINTNLGFGDYANMARVDGAGFFSRNMVALMSKLYTMGPTIVTGVGRGATKIVGNYIGDCF